MTTTARELREGRSLADPDLFHRLVQRVAEEHDHNLGMAARVVDQVLAFLGTSATHQGRPLSPSEEVDPGWHEFILHTVDYAAFCEQIAGRFLHHVPTDLITDGEIDAPLRPSGLPPTDRVPRMVIADDARHLMPTAGEGASPRRAAHPPSSLIMTHPSALLSAGRSDTDRGETCRLVAAPEVSG